MTALSRDEILARKVYGDVERVPLGDGYVVVRGLTRGEAHETYGKSTIDAETIAIAYGMVEPAMSRDDVAEWLAADVSGAIQPVITAIQRLSGNEDGAGKEYTKSVSGRESETVS